MDDFALSASGDDGDDPFKIYTRTVDKKGHRAKQRYNSSRAPDSIYFEPWLYDAMSNIADEVPQFHGPTGFIRNACYHEVKKWQEKLAKDGKAAVDTLAYDIIMEEEARERDNEVLIAAFEKWAARMKACPEKDKAVEELRGRSLIQRLHEANIFVEALDRVSPAEGLRYRIEQYERENPSS